MSDAVREQRSAPCHGACTRTFLCRRQTPAHLLMRRGPARPSYAPATSTSLPRPTSGDHVGAPAGRGPPAQDQVRAQRQVRAFRHDPARPRNGALVYMCACTVCAGAPHAQHAVCAGAPHAQHAVRAGTVRAHDHATNVGHAAHTTCQDRKAKTGPDGARRYMRQARGRACMRQARGRACMRQARGRACMRGKCGGRVRGQSAGPSAGPSAGAECGAQCGAQCVGFGCVRCARCVARAEKRAVRAARC
jgi:hypothetical protein